MMSTTPTKDSSSGEDIRTFRIHRTFKDRINDDGSASPSTAPDFNPGAVVVQVARLPVDPLASIRLALSEDSAPAGSCVTERHASLLASKDSQWGKLPPSAIAAAAVELERLRAVRQFVKALPDAVVAAKGQSNAAGSPAQGIFASPDRPLGSSPLQGVAPSTLGSSPQPTGLPSIQRKGRGALRSGSGTETGCKSSSSTIAALRAMRSTSGSVALGREGKKALAELFTHWAIHFKNEPPIGGNGDAQADQPTFPSSRTKVFSYDVDRRVSLATDPSVVGILRSATVYEGWLAPVQADTETESGETPRRAIPSHDEGLRKVELSDLRLVDPVPTHIDPLIPCGEIEPRGCCVVVFQRCLQVCGGEKASAQKAGLEITRLAAEAREKVAKANSSSLERQVVQVVKEMIEVPGSAETMESTVLTLQGVSTPILSQYLEKLWLLYIPFRKYNSTNENGDGSSPAPTQPEMEEFHLRAFTLLLRYFSLAGGTEDCDHNSGFHASIHPRLAVALRQYLGVEAECFASPLNTNQPYFCSLFPDTDVWFGSLGLFWDFHPSEGSFHVNPPFETHVMLRTAKKLSSLLDAPNAGPLSFFVVLPAWEHGKMDETVEILRGKFCVRYAIVPSSQCTYVDGHQHVLQESSFVIRSDTHSFLLQNEAGRRKWPAEGFDTAIGEWVGSLAGISIAGPLKRGREEE